MYWYDVLIRCIDTMHWYDALIRCIDTMYWYDVLIRCIDTMYWYDVYTCRKSFYLINSQATPTCLAALRLTLAWHPRHSGNRRSYLTSYCHVSLYQSAIELPNNLFHHRHSSKYFIMSWVSILHFNEPLLLTDSNTDFFIYCMFRSSKYYVNVNPNILVDEIL